MLVDRCELGEAGRVGARKSAMKEEEESIAGAITNEFGLIVSQRER